MPKKTAAEAQEPKSVYRVKPRTQVNVRGLEYNESARVELSDSEFAALSPRGGRPPVVPEVDFDGFMEAFAAGSIDHNGNTIPKVPEADEETEAGQ